jgi:hypothetical protein
MVDALGRFTYGRLNLLMKLSTSTGDPWLAKGGRGAKVAY